MKIVLNKSKLGDANLQQVKLRKANAALKTDTSSFIKLNKAAATKAANQVKRADSTSSNVEQSDNANAVHSFDKSEAIAALQKKISYEQLDKSQRQACDLLLANKYAALTGAAGTGKTTTVGVFLDLLLPQLPTIDIRNTRKLTQDEYTALSIQDNETPAVAFCAYTGIASMQIEKNLPPELHKNVSTIHTLLGYYPEMEDVPITEEEYKKNPTWYEKYPHGMRTVQRWYPSYNASNKLKFECIIMDESSMTPADLWNELLAALPDSCRIYLVGDINQLQPITSHSPLAYALKNWPVAELKTIHRQASDNPIITLATKVREGNRFTNTLETPVAKWLRAPASAKDTFRTAIAAIKALYHKGSFDPATDAIIVPSNQSTLGQIALNVSLVSIFNPTRYTEQKRGAATIQVPINPRITIKTGKENVTYAVGDKIMVLQNNHKEGLANGMIGFVESIERNPKFKGIYGDEAETIGDVDLSDLDLSGDIFGANELDFISNSDEPKDKTERQASHIMKVRFVSNNEVHEFKSAGEFSQMALAYAFTCHKSQGSEFKNVVVICHSVDAVLLTREWLYTAVTRAKKALLVIGNDKGVRQAINRQVLAGANAIEKADLLIRKVEQQKSTAEKPKLPKPCLIDANFQAPIAITLPKPKVGFTMPSKQ